MLILDYKHENAKHTIYEERGVNAGVDSKSANSVDEATTIAK